MEKGIFADTLFLLDTKMVLRAGIEPARPYGHRIFLPATTFAAYFFAKVICGLDFIFAFY